MPGPTAQKASGYVQQQTSDVRATGHTVNAAKVATRSYCVTYDARIILQLGEPVAILVEDAASVSAFKDYTSELRQLLEAC